MRDRSALIVCWSPLARDPRVQRQIAWLSQAGWAVDTLGEGPSPSPAVRAHYEMDDAPRWSRNRLLLGLVLLLFPYGSRFRLLIESRFPSDVTRRARSGEYDLIVSNDLDFLPWSTKVGRASGARTHHHLDLHEYHPRDLPEGTSVRALQTGFHRWTRRMIPSAVFRTRSTVAPAIAALYATEFSIDAPAVIRNCPDPQPLTPSPVDVGRIELVYHGLAAWDRGLGEILDALPMLESRFRVTFMLTGDEALRQEVAERVSTVGDRAIIIDPVPWNEVARRINTFDLEIMFFPPVTENLRLALPNKLFEATQGRLGVVIGRSPSMEEVVDEWGNGTVVDGWTPRDLAAGLNALSAEDIRRFKDASHRAAAVFNAEHEGEAFTRLVGPS